MVGTFVCVAVLIGAAAELPTVTVTADDTVIDKSCRIVIPPHAVLKDAKNDGVLQVKASDIVLEFAPGSELRGSDPNARPDTYEGCGIRIVGQKNVTIRGARISGFRTGLWATNASGLKLENVDGSDGRRSHLGSDRLLEDGRDWTSAHENDNNQWLGYGAAIYVEDSNNIVVQRCKVWHSQNALLLDRVNDSRIYDNDLSFNSGWGLGLWRSSNNVITRNAIDFCVRGYSHMIYNRGQDSAGMLFFEQDCNNVIAENSVTHGGDGFFGFAGREALGQGPKPEGFDYARKGCNDNLFVGNDFSYAPAHGIEMTFSFGNRYLSNRLVGNAICGLWGGYSQDSLIAGNTIENNGEMAYGSERGGINIDSSRNNRIIHNAFKGNACAVHLWWAEPGKAGQKGPWIETNLKDGRGNIAADNTFDGDLVVWDLRGPGEVTLARNTEQHVGDEFFRDGDPKIVQDESLQVPPVEMPKYPVFGDTHPVGARPQLRGRENIIMTEWGPWDHVGPLLQLVEHGPRRHVYALHNVPAGAKVTIDGAGLTGRDLAPAHAQPGSDSAPGTRRYEITAAQDGVYPYTLVTQAGDQLITTRGTLLAATWDVTTFDVDPNDAHDQRTWRKAAEGPNVEHHTLDFLELIRRLPGQEPPPRLPPSRRTTTPGRNVGLIARTKVLVPAGRWRLDVVSDQAVRVHVNDRLLIDGWRRGRRMGHRTTDLEQKEAGMVELVVEQFQNGRPGLLSFSIAPAPTLTPIPTPTSRPSAAASPSPTRPAPATSRPAR